MEIKAISKEIHETAVDKGFWDSERNVGELLMLTVSELSEALEAHRKSRFCTADVADLNEWDADAAFKERFLDEVKDTFEDEIADAVIRLFDIAEGMDFDLEQHIAAKLRFNKTRPHKHGKLY